MNRTPSAARLALVALAAAALGLAGCDRGAHDAASTAPATTGDATAVAGNAGTAPAPSPGMSGSPGTGGRDPASADLNALPPTAAGSAASGSGADAGGTSQPLAAGDRKFVTEAAQGGMFEVQVSQLAAGKATDPAVKQFAQMLLADHSNANDQLKALASAHNVTLPTDLPRALKSELEQLRKAEGKEFDRQYAKMVGIKDHKEDIARFEQAGREVRNADIKAWIDKTLPTLKEHLAAARKLPENGGNG